MLYVLLAVLLLVILIAVLLNVNANLRLQYDNNQDEVKLTLSYLGFTYVILPENEERKRRKEEKNRKKQEKLRKKGIKPEKKQKFSFREMFKEQGIRGFAEDMIAIVKSLWALITGVLRRAELRELTFNMKVAGEDAADTAVTFGYINAAVYPVVSALLENVSEYEEPDVNISPDFEEGAESEVLISVHLKIKPSKLLGAILENRSSAEKLLSAFGKNNKKKV
ncbi:MAG: DUF2953 domain-containing protein [Ruminococcus sp.]|nr:DUF2953 domain-containing protein [Ruminococcus sp.]